MNILVYMQIPFLNDCMYGYLSKSHELRVYMNFDKFTVLYLLQINKKIMIFIIRKYFLENSRHLKLSGDGALCNGKMLA